MGLRDLLKKKENVEGIDSDPDTVSRLATPEFTFIRSDTFSEEIIHPPNHPAQSDDNHNDPYLNVRERDGSSNSNAGGKNRLSLSSFRSPRDRTLSVSSNTSAKEEKPSTVRRLSHRLHLHRSPSSSEVVPQNLPEIVYTPDDKEGTELQWEKRATILARENEKHRSRPASPVQSGSSQRYSFDTTSKEFAQLRLAGEEEGTAASPEQAQERGNTNGGREATEKVNPEKGGVSTKAIDEDIQEAIRLHEEGDLRRSTAIFGRLADPKGANNPLSQVLYGLALRHGWGCDPDPGAAVNYLSAAASNAAIVENLALQAGLKKGGAAKGELVLAIFELANCFRHGWGIPKDSVAAKQYYETAANLGDTDAMNEAAWCYLEGFGTKKDKYAAAKYYRLAEQNGNKTLGNSWIWKDKYTPGYSKK